MREERDSRFYRHSGPEIYLVGIGMGGEGQLTLESQRAIAEADVVAGAGRMLKSVENLLFGKKVLDCYEADEIGRWLEAQREEIQTGVILFSGDTGFYSGAKKVKEKLELSGWKVTVLPGISSISYCAARFGIDWQDAKITSLHGREEDYIRQIREHGKCFFLLGGQITPEILCENMIENGLGDCLLSFGSDLSYPEENQLSGSVRQLLTEQKKELEDLSRLVCCFIENPTSKTASGLDSSGFSFRDQDFIRGKVPMTKEEIRTIALAKLKLWEGACFYDVGAGTGSVAIAAAKILQDTASQVFAIERNPDGLDLIEKNRKALIPDRKGFFIIPGEAPDAFSDLPIPSHAFIGGSGGQLTAMIQKLLMKNRQIRIVITAITLETLSECLEVMKKWNFAESEIIQAGISETVTAGPYHMQMGRNPVYIVTLAGYRGKKETGNL